MIMLIQLLNFPIGEQSEKKIIYTEVNYITFAQSFDSISNYGKKINYPFC
jgi:hypothetical protein